MFELILIIITGAIAYRIVSNPPIAHEEVPKRISNRLTGLWDVAQKGMKEDKLVRAEKALLTILKIDEKNAAAYNRLGILYAKQKEFDDAIDCFEIASTMERSASSLHNLGLIYYETEQYEKASIAFKQALELEDRLAARHIAYAKTLERIGRDTEMLEELEIASELEPNQETLNLLLRAYQTRDMDKEAKQTERRLKKVILSKKRTRTKRPAKAVV